MSMRQLASSVPMVSIQHFTPPQILNPCGQREKASEIKNPVGFSISPLESQRAPACVKVGGGGTSATVSVVIVPPPAISAPYSLRFLLLIERYDAQHQQAVSP